MVDEAHRSALAVEYRLAVRGGVVGAGDAGVGRGRRLDGSR